jgi:putative endonuclease
MSYRQRIGEMGEDLAVSYLLTQCCEILDRNYHTPYGELDLVVRQPGVTIFVEVKTRTGTAYGHPEEAITEKKKHHLINSAQAYLQDHPELGDNWRIDVIAIQKKPRVAEPEIVWFENAVV